MVLNRTLLFWNGVLGEVSFVHKSTEKSSFFYCECLFYFLTMLIHVLFFLLCKSSNGCNLSLCLLWNQWPFLGLGYGSSLGYPSLSLAAVCILPDGSSSKQSLNRGLEKAPGTLKSDLRCNPYAWGYLCRDDNEEIVSFRGGRKNPSKAKPT